MADLTILLLRACLALLAMPIYLLSFVGIWKPFCKKVFIPYVLGHISDIHLKKSKKQRQELFQTLPDFRRGSGELRLLEIGTGCGVNFEFYPPGCKVTCTDINPNFQQFLSKNMAKNQHLHFEQFLVASGDDLHQVPSGSVDAVICTLVLCSVNNISGTLEEVLRVLRPGGAFYFLEHVAADPSSWKYFWQQICHPTWKLIFDGCCLTRELWKNLQQANFSELKLRHVSVALPWTPVDPHIVGYAVK
ncbi:methyltransferase-like protein 7A [Calypte anna]|nr:methyltransferase-like protein 7A [Calypte anna]XP_030323988.1 methyltransferase-like protein 7A [Calypte anna]